MENKNQFRDRWKDYLSFSKRERKGLYVFFVLILIESGILLWNYFRPATYSAPVSEEFKKEIDEFLASEIKDSSANERPDYNELRDDVGNASERTVKAELFSFNPNNLPDADWKRLGFSDKQIRVLNNYQTKGGKFRSKADVKKMYCISEKQFAIIEPYISIPEPVRDTVHPRFQSDAGTIPERKTKAELFSFNPNNLPDDDWKRLGFSDKQIRVLNNYQSKGGKFRTKADVKKMYCISEEQFARIEPYISIPEPTRDSTRHEYSFKRNAPSDLIVDIGTADTLELMKLSGIGPSYARRIFKYRERLGGFYSVEQLKEIWNFPDSLYQFIFPHITLKDANNINRININTADYKELTTLPYIDRNLANVLVNYRTQHGSFHSIEEIKKVPLINEELYSKLAHYLKTE